MFHVQLGRHVKCSNVSANPSIIMINFIIKTFLGSAPGSPDPQQTTSAYDMELPSLN